MTTRVSFLLLIVVLGTVTLAGTQGFAALKSKPAPRIFAEMAGQASKDEALKMYSDFSALPVNKRKASFRTVSPSDQSILWRTHLALSLIKRPELDESQKEIILAAMSLASPEHFAVLSGERSWKTKVRNPLRVLEADIMTAFSFEDAAKIFATLGDDTELASTAVSNSSVLLKTINYKSRSDYDPYKQWTSRFTVQDLPVEGGNCSCSTDSDWCPMSGYCGGGGCTGTQSGCGTLWSWPCNGSCR